MFSADFKVYYTCCDPLCYINAQSFTKVVFNWKAKQHPGRFFNQGMLEYWSWRSWLLQALPGFRARLLRCCPSHTETSSILPLLAAGTGFHPPLKKLFSRTPWVLCWSQNWNNNIWKTDLLSEGLYINSASSSPHGCFHKGPYPDLDLIRSINLFVARWKYIGHKWRYLMFRYVANRKYRNHIIIFFKTRRLLFLWLSLHSCEFYSTVPMNALIATFILLWKGKLGALSPQ